jgi:hypothetical protein
MFDGVQQQGCAKCGTCTIHFKEPPLFEVKFGKVARGLDRGTQYFRLKRETGEEEAIRVGVVWKSARFGISLDFPKELELRRGDDIAIVYRVDGGVDPDFRQYPILIKNITVGGQWFFHGSKNVRIFIDQRGYTHKTLSFANPLLPLATEAADKAIGVRTKSQPD